MRKLVTIGVLVALLFLGGPVRAQAVATPDSPAPSADAPDLDLDLDLNMPATESEKQASEESGEPDETISEDKPDAAPANGDEASKDAASGDEAGNSPAEGEEAGKEATKGPDEGEPKTPPAKVALPELSPEARALRDEIRQCLAYYFVRPLTTQERSPWAVMHAIVGFGVDTPLDVGRERVNAIGWMCWNQPCYNMRLFTLQNGQVAPQLGPGYQGHEGQFLQMMALSRVPKSFGMKVEGRDLTIEDLIRHEQLTCRAGTELTFKLLGLTHYLGTEATWHSQDGQPWNIERLLKEELSQPVIGAACGGTHRIGSLGVVVRKRELSGLPMSETWLRARKYVHDYQAYTFKLQNSDGSFSTSWFEGRGNAADVDRKLNTSGHTLEWLLLTLPDDRLNDPRLVSAVKFVKDWLWYYRGHKWEVGHQGHAIHALVLYDERVFGGRAGQRSAELTQLAKTHDMRTPPDPAPAKRNDPIASKRNVEKTGPAWRQAFRNGRG